MFQNYHLLSDDGFEIKSKYYSFNCFLFLTRVVSLQDVFLQNMFYFVFYKGIFFIFYNVVQPDFQMLFLAVLTEFILLAFLIVNFYLGWYKTYVGR